MASPILSNMPTSKKQQPQPQQQQQPQQQKSGKEDWPEPKVKWGKSKARKLLCVDIMEGRAPRSSRENGRLTRGLEDTHNSREEFKKHHHSKFSSRLGRLRKSIDDLMSRKDLDQQAFDNYVANHPVSHFSHKGHIQWQGSEAQQLALRHIEQNMHNTTKWSEWHGEHAEFYENFDLATFKDKIRQEMRTAKCLCTLEVRGKDARKTKGNTNEAVE